VVNNGKEPTGAVNYYNMIGNSADGAANHPHVQLLPPQPQHHVLPTHNPNATPNPERTGYGNIAGFGTEPINRNTTSLTETNSNPNVPNNNVRDYLNKLEYNRAKQTK
jgi:hypothetical protein